MTPREAYIVLNQIEGIGPVRTRALCEALGSPEAVLAAPASQLAGVRGVGPKVAENIVAQRGRLDPGREEAVAARLGARLVTPDDAEYPKPLKNIYDPPLCLYVRGAWEEQDEQALAIVGTRRATHYGAAQAERLAYQAAKAGFTVVSGLARGIDTVAHRAALKAGGRTLAVLGGALDKLYPPENRELAEEIAAQGALLSEFPLGREPDRTTFPYRNRIVSGLSKGVLVVEAGLESGAMNTAEQALEQGRSVMAVPGRVDMDGARGPHRLIQNGARLVADLADILKEFEFLFPPAEQARLVRQQDARQRLTLAPAEEKVVRALWTEPEMDMDVLIRRTGLSSAQIMTLAMQLEMKRVLRRLPGRRLALMDEIRQWELPPAESAN
ncbi:MAG: DNA-processing protein DprA [Kiritimatiellae bacterium]|jgi:DNA processing protein|nr:DNA-processing protein DprA [Kiritimatiellia bacterium]NLD89801.1 DNA-protecting protein DprA [Lentisphaerota bacterium]HPC19499.1 DNA-processing protein DprA [Kiritimatiellia bacterium]HQN79559.1 DNA-processing protein DprA [Kiritimatiellia bacterium]HQQ61708.1 DNA-processing protein DprA [Kiritimatiellia bacterium]